LLSCVKEENNDKVNKPYSNLKSLKLHLKKISEVLQKIKNPTKKQLLQSNLTLIKATDY